ncbi:TonB-dependent receptor [Chitinimonas sp.]|uniref:TonB-dependent receptor n=1 Tax=Chitinimonas sp. TaxID=1934313 RepID=UPI0035B1D552
MKLTHLALAISAIGVAIPALAAGEVQKIEKIEVTGSNIKRSTRSASPVQTVTAVEIRQSGANSIPELLQKIPALGAGNGIDSADGGFSRGVSTASLRGLGSASTLVLLNGRRLAPAAYADPNSGQSTIYDLNSLPLSAIERIEILKDGASAVYGSDAVAGVINFITKRNYNGAEGSASLAANDNGKFGRQRANFFAGFGDMDSNGYNVMVAGDYSHRDRVSITDLKDVATDELKYLNGWNSNYSSIASEIPLFYKEARPGSGSFNRFAGQNLSGCAASQIVTGSTASPQWLTATNPLVGQKFCAYNAYGFSEAAGKADDESIMSRGTFRFSDNLTGFAEAAYAKSDRYYTSASRTIDGRTPTAVFPLGGAPAQFNAVLPVGHPDNPTNGTATPQRVAVVYRFVDTPSARKNTNENTRLLAGLKGSNWGWDWESALTWNESKRKETNGGFLDYATVKNALDNNVRLADLAKSPTLARTAVMTGKSTLTEWDAKASTEFGELAGGAIGFATGIELREEKMEIVPDPATASGSIIGLANQASNAKRNVSAVFVEARAPFLENLEAELAGRYDKYDGFAGNFVPKVGLKWSATKSLTLRGTYSEGFRAPALVQIKQGATQFFLNSFSDPVRCGKDGAEALDCSKSVSGIASANPNLKPEKSRSTTFGLVWGPLNNLDVIIDYYRIRKDKEVDLLDGTFVVNHPELYASYILRNPNPDSFLKDASGKPIPGTGPLWSVGTPYINSGSTVVKGVDIELALRNNLGEYGKLSSRLNLGYVISYSKGQQEGDPLYNVVGTRGGLANFATSTGDIPRTKFGLSSTWTRGDHALTGKINYVSSVSLVRQTDDGITLNDPQFCHYGLPSRVPEYTKLHPDCSVSSWTTFDMAYNYSGIKNLTLGFNIVNLFDRAAPYDPNGGTSSGNFIGYDSTLHSAAGRVFSASANYKFW